MLNEASPDGLRIRAADLLGALSLATDLALGVPLEYGLHSTLIAMRLCERLGVDSDTAAQTYYGCLAFYIGCTADAQIAADIFDGDDALTTHALPVRFGSRIEMMAGITRALTPPSSAPLTRGVRMVQGLPRAARAFKHHVAAFCEVAQMLTNRLGLPDAVSALFPYVAERWDGNGEPGRAEGDEIPLPVRIVHVARDAAFQRLLGREEFAAQVVRNRAGGAFDPAIATLLADEATEILALDTEASAWEETLVCEPIPQLTLEDEAIDRALAAFGDFADLASPYLVGHSAGVAELATAAAGHCGFEAADLATIRRGAFVHDVGRVAVPVRIWQKSAPLTADDWERVRLHAYHSERVLSRSGFLAALAPVATSHHERLDGSGYHRGVAAATLGPGARLLAAADAYHAMTEPRPHREAHSPEHAAETLGQEARAGRLGADAVAAVLEVSGHRVPRVERPGRLTDREAEVVSLLARGLQTKQVARALGISVKTADRHIQNAYRKIGVSTRAAAALFAMEHGLSSWENSRFAARPAARSILTDRTIRRAGGRHALGEGSGGIGNTEMSGVRETESVETVVVGGGQAGLSVGYHLARRGAPFVILDSNERIGDSWRNRWDSLRLFTPARYNSLAGMRFPAPAHSFPTKNEMADYLEAYAGLFDLPVRSGVKVDGLSRSSGNRRGFVVTSGDTCFEADNVVVAMATHQRPRVPTFAADLDPGIVQLHSSDYRSPSQLQAGGLLLVGAGNSGAEIALDTARSHPVWLSGRDTGHVPFRIETVAARLLIPLVLRILFHRVLTVNTPMGRKVRAKLVSHGHALVRAKPQDLAAAGVERVPKVMGVRDGLPLLEDGRVLEVANVIWCTGFDPDFSWIDLPVFSEREPKAQRGVVADEPGLYFVGLLFLYAASSTMIHGVGRDAKHVVEAIASRR